jgi:hypothetical protein
LLGFLVIGGGLGATSLGYSFKMVVMLKIHLIFLFATVFSFAEIFSQNEIDSLITNDADYSNYKFKLSLEPQDGYSLILQGNGAPKDNVSANNFEIGFSRTIISTGGHETGVMDRTFTLGIINYNGNSFSTLGFGYNFRSILDLGLFLNFNNDFNGNNSFTLRPHIGFFCLPPYGSAYAEFGYNFHFLRNNFEIPNLFSIGLRYNIGFLKSNQDKDKSNKK